MADFFKGLQGGFNTGLQLGGQLRKRRMEKELSQIEPEYEVAKGTGLRVRDAEGNVSEGVGGNLSQEELAAARSAYEAQGYQVEGIGDRYTARSGQGRDVGMFETAAGATPTMREENYGLMDRRAGVYEKYGEAEMARGIRRDARTMRREDQQYDMDQERLTIAKDEAARAETRHQWLVAERNKLDGMEAAMQAYSTGNWAQLSDLATNVWGDNYRYDISPDGKVVTILDKQTGEPVGQKPMPDAETFQQMLLRSDSKNWLPLMQRDDQIKRDQVAGERWQKEHDLRKQELTDNRNYRAQSLRIAGQRSTGATEQMIALAERAANGDKVAERTLQLLGRRDHGGAKPMSPIEALEFKQALREEIRAQNPKLSPQALNRLVEQQFAASVGGAQTPDPYAGLSDDPAPKGAPPPNGTPTPQRPAPTMFGLSPAGQAARTARAAEAELARVDALLKNPDVTANPNVRAELERRRAEALQQYREMRLRAIE